VIPYCLFNSPFLMFRARQARGLVGVLEFRPIPSNLTA